MAQSRNDALLAAREAQAKAEEAEEAANLLSKEAVAQVRLFTGAGWVPPKKKAPEVLLQKGADSRKVAETKEAAQKKAAQKDDGDDDDDDKDDDDKKAK